MASNCVFFIIKKTVIRKIWSKYLYDVNDAVKLEEKNSLAYTEKHNNRNK